MAVGVPPDYRDAIARYGRLADAEAAKWGETGESLLAKVLGGESGFRMRAVSSVGARGAGQFMPGTREEFVEQYGVDPWASPDSAVLGTAIFLRDRGLRKYNPGGGQEYLDYILGQQVTGVPRGRAGRATGQRAPSVPDDAAPAGEVVDEEGRSTLLKIVITVGFVLGGLVLAGLGTTRALGARAKAGAA